MIYTPTNCWITFTGIPGRHRHCVELWAPSTFLHLSDKLLQLASTNCTDGGHYNTQILSRSWNLYWTLASQKRSWIEGLIKKSAVNAPNKGSVFNFEQFQRLVTAVYNLDCGVSFPVWMTNRFMGVSFLLGALRTEQFDRFRAGGLRAITWNRSNRDENHLDCIQFLG